MIVTIGKPQLIYPLFTTVNCRNFIINFFAIPVEWVELFMQQLDTQQTFSRFYIKKYSNCSSSCTVARKAEYV